MSRSEENTPESTDASSRKDGDLGTSTDQSGANETGPDGSLDQFDPDELATLVEELQSENQRLRGEYARAKQGEYRRSAVVLLLIGVSAVLGAVAFPPARDLLFILGAAGLFSGGLMWYLTPERLVTATVGQSVYESVADIGMNIRDELGLAGESIYVPVDRTDATGAPVKLFIPQSSTPELPDDDALESLFVLPESADRRGVSTRPTAARLVSEFEKSLVGPVSDDPRALMDQLVEALVDQFELVDTADPNVDAEANRIAVEINGGVYNDGMAFDNPAVSFLATGVAYGLGEPITVETTESDGKTLITLHW